MGIPSYFSYIVKNHSNIIRKLECLQKVDNFYLDSNSIIYDCLRKEMSKYKGKDKTFETGLIKAIIVKLEEYINIIKPSNNIIIAFDGVAPVAKLEQQRTRRYKSYLMNKITASIESKEDQVWDKTAITPGTKFMENMGKKIKKHFEGKEKKYKLTGKIIVSLSSEPGEGEHKIFDFIRKNSNNHGDQTTLVYGLDADLIMLCLNHLYISKSIYLYRETPEFIKSINNELIPNENYFLDISELSEAIIEKMTGKNKITNYKIYLQDYIILCFLLGNDFLPHFPSVNIRTSGIHTLLATYSNILGNKNKHMTDGKNLIWANIKLLIEQLAEMEHNNFKIEHKKREKYSKKFYKTDTIEEKMHKLTNIPSIKREKEIYIDPFNFYWEKRYYEKLFDLDINKAYKQTICINYLEGLEWVYKYYSEGCIDWRWKYKFHYPPLFTDLVNYIPSWGTTMLEPKEENPVSEIVQLSYVLPNPSLKLLPKKIEKVLREKNGDKYPKDCELEWSYCKYLWESHPKLPHMNINVLEEMVMP